MPNRVCLCSQLPREAWTSLVFKNGTQQKMSRVENLWERLVRAALRRERIGTDAFGRPVGGIAGYVPSSLTNNRDIDAILRAADEIQDEDPNQKLAKREGGTIDRSQDIARLQEFYKLYREKNDVDKLREEEMQLRESGAFSGNLGVLERKTVKRKRVFATLKVLGSVLEQLTSEIPEELKRMIESDAAMTEDLIAYNIIPLDGQTMTNAIVAFPEVRAAATALKYFQGLPQLPVDFPIPATRSPDMLDFLHYIFGFQKDNVSNQREHVVHLLANEQSRLGIPDTTEPDLISDYVKVLNKFVFLELFFPYDVIKSIFAIRSWFFQKLDEAAVQKVFIKSLDNYIKWCSYLCIQPVWSNLEAVSKEKKLLFLSLYFLIWGEAANVRFLPECLCYIFHHMVREMDEILRQQIAQPANSCNIKDENRVSFLDQVITPLYEVVAAEAGNNDNGRAPHSAWRNYDDFNEYFWSLHCFELSWPWRKNSSFFQKPKPRTKYLLKTAGSQRRGKTSFVEHRTFLHLYHSFHRLKALQEESKQNSSSVLFRLYVIVVGIYGGVQFFLSFFMRIPACHHMTNQCDHWPFIRFIKWMRQERYYVGRGMYERTSDFIKYMLFWLVVLGGKFSFAYFLQIQPLVKPTRAIVDMTDSLQYSWHDLVSKSKPVVLFDVATFCLLAYECITHGEFSVIADNHNALTVVSLWAPVIAIYLLDIHVFYTIISAIYGFLLGARDRLGEIRSLEAVHKLFEDFPGAFMNSVHIPLSNRHDFVDFLSHPLARYRDLNYFQLFSSSFSLCLSSESNLFFAEVHAALQTVVEKRKIDAASFAPFWNEIIHNLREEDYIFLAKDMVDGSYSQDELRERISRDDYMKYAVEEGYHALRYILTEILEGEGRMWVERIYADIEDSIAKRTIHVDFRLNKLSLVITRVIGLLGILKAEKPDLEKGAVKAVQDLYDVVRHDVLSIDMREHYETWNFLSKARAEGRLFTNLKWPRDPELDMQRTQIKRLYSLLTIKDSAATIPKNIEARRRLEFFTNSLFMDLPVPRPVREMLSFSVFTPYYSETVLYSLNELQKKNEDGISTLFYLQKIYPDEWKNFLGRIGRDENAPDTELFDSPNDILELRFWASYRGQTLARTVRGMMYYRKALMLQSYLERVASGDVEAAVSYNDSNDTKGFELSPEARALAGLKFTYVVTCQIYGKQKEDQKPEAADIALLMQRNEALRVAFIDEVESLKEGKVQKEFYSKLVKADINGKDKEIYSVKLPGNPKLGEGKPENQNHAIIFTRGNAIQTIDMNQDNYFEEALKMRNLLEEFHQDHGIRLPTILGVREHVFTGSVSSLALFMSNQETSFVTLGQRVLANPLKVRMHYGHPDVFDRVFHITRGGISKASRVINIRFNSTLRQGNITHHEYIQVGKGRDVGLNQIAVFEGKVAGGNGEQVLSRDVYRLGQLFDFFRMMSFYFTTVGYYFCTMLTVLTVYAFLYGKAYLALSGVGEQIQVRARVMDNTALSAAMNTQFLFQIGVFTAVPMVLGFILEQGFLRAVVSFITMQLQLCSVFFTFSLGTKTHYFGRTILHGGARYQATGRGFVVRHIRFSENYRLYSRSHFVKGLEVVLLLVVYLAYGYNEGGALAYILLTVSSWFMALSWLFAPYLFNPSGFEWQKTVEDFRDWTNWLFYRGGIGVKGQESWEAWWEEELYGVVYKLDIQGTDTSLSVIHLLKSLLNQFSWDMYLVSEMAILPLNAVYGFSWIVLAVLIILFKVFTFSQKISVNFQLLLRFIQGATFLLSLAGLVVAVVVTDLSVSDIFASILAFIPTIWGILSIASAWKPLMKRMGLWKSIRSIARLYDAGMGMLIFIPVALFSWFPFVSTFQTRLMFNQAFSRGLEISLILAVSQVISGLGPYPDCKHEGSIEGTLDPRYDLQVHLEGPEEDSILRSTSILSCKLLCCELKMFTSATTVDHESAATAIDESSTADSDASDFYSVTDVESQSSHESTTGVDDDESETFQAVSKSAAKSFEPRSSNNSNWKGKNVSNKRMEIPNNNLALSGGVGGGGGGYKPPSLNELQTQNRMKARKYYHPKKKFNNRFAPYAPRNTTSFIIRAKKSGGIASLVSPCPVTPAVLPTPIFSPSREVLGDMAKEEWGVDGYGSMKGLIRLRSPGNEANEDEEDEEGNGSSESDVEEHVEVERRLDHDLSRFEMIYPSAGGGEYIHNNVLENRVDDQDTHIAQLEEENLTLKERLFLMERELGDLRRRLQFLERQQPHHGQSSSAMVVEDVNEEVVENVSENESDGGSDIGGNTGGDGNEEVMEYVGGNELSRNIGGRVKEQTKDVCMEENVPDDQVIVKHEVKDEKAGGGFVASDEVMVKESEVKDVEKEDRFVATDAETLKVEAKDEERETEVLADRLVAKEEQQPVRRVDSDFLLATRTGYQSTACPFSVA
ncbi:unnamed protein product [Dovyalis caffra]|uniref:1,3-beta-glucan synthase n=1 Tax=Dovyalis caffra TaxID=77055 RepID=A0AAV1RUQ7_9ROSI|nr:unnamed protein product [Dovyalis caffra]